MTRKVRSPNSSAMLNGSWSLRCTPAAVTMLTVARESSFSKGVNGTHFLDSSDMARPLQGAGESETRCPLRPREDGYRGLQISQDVKDLFVVRLLTDVMDVFVGDFAFFIDHKQGAFTDPIFFAV